MQLQASGGGAGIANGQHPPIEAEKEFVICSLDLISGLAESLGPAMEGYVGRSNLRAILIQCCQVRSRPQLLTSSDSRSGTQALQLAIT